MIRHVHAIQRLAFLTLALASAPAFASCSLANPPPMEVVASQEPSTSDAEVSLSMKVLKNRQFEGKERVLHIGCEGHDIAATIAKTIPEGQVTVIDIPEDWARSPHTELSQLPNVVFRAVDPSAFQSDLPFDLIISLNCPHWFAGSPEALQRLSNLLAPGGDLILRLSMPLTVDALHGSVTDVIEDEQWKAYFVDVSLPTIPEERTPQQYRELLIEVGLKPSICEKAKHMTRFADRQVFAAWLLTWLPHARLIPEQKQGAFVEEVTTHYLKKTAQNGQAEVYFSDYPWEIHAYKAASSTP